MGRTTDEFGNLQDDEEEFVDKEAVEERKAIEIDGGNAVELVNIGIVLEAVEDKIIVKIDDYKTGYECAICNQTGKVPSRKKDEPDVECENCHGKGVTLVVPDSAKHLPTSGIILSVGPMTKNKIRERELAKARIKDKIKTEYIASNTPDERGFKIIPTNYYEQTLLDFPENKIKLGQRVIFTAHVGTFIPFKGNAHLKVMREHEPLCIMFGADTGAKSFMELSEEF